MAVQGRGVHAGRVVTLHARQTVCGHSQALEVEKEAGPPTNPGVYISVLEVSLLEPRSLYCQAIFL